MSLLLSFSGFAVALFARLSLVLAFPVHRGELSEAEKATSEHLSWLGALAGFSLGGLAILTSSSTGPVAALVDILFSFILLLASSSVQFIKQTRWEEAIGIALRDGATWSLMLGVIRLCWRSVTAHYGNGLALALALFALAAWLLQFVRTMYFAISFGRSAQKASTSPRPPGGTDGGTEEATDQA